MVLGEFRAGSIAASMSEFCGWGELGGVVEEFWGTHSVSYEPNPTVLSGVILVVLADPIDVIWDALK